MVDITINFVDKRIKEIETMKEKMNKKIKEKQDELVQAEIIINEIRESINMNIFENTEESKELEELKNVKHWLSKNEGKILDNNVEDEK